MSIVSIMASASRTPELSVIVTVPVGPRAYSTMCLKTILRLASSTGASPQPEGMPPRRT